MDSVASAAMSPTGSVIFVSLSLGIVSQLKEPILSSITSRHSSMPPRIYPTSRSLASVLLSEVQHDDHKQPPQYSH